MKTYFCWDDKNNEFRTEVKANSIGEAATRYAEKCWNEGLRELEDIVVSVQGTKNKKGFWKIKIEPVFRLGKNREHNHDHDVCRKRANRDKHEQDLGS